MNGDKIDLNQELEVIIRNRLFKKEDTEKWTLILSTLPSYMEKVITEEYSIPLDTIVKDPLNSKRNETLKAFIKRIINQLLKNFDSYPPFTIVRFSEILITPKKHYNTSDKFLRALENVIQVSSSIADFPQPSFDVKVNDNVENNKTNGGAVPVTIGSDDSQTIFLTNIPWLTEEDIKEIESESYLAEEYPLNEPPLNEYDNEERPLENEQKKRILEEQNDSPEKKHKPGENDPKHESEHIEDSNEVDSSNGKDDEQEVPNVSKEKPKEEQENDRRDKSDESTKDVSNDPSKESSNAENNEDTSIIEADEITLDEDRMDINTTLEEDQMDVD